MAQPLTARETYVGTNHLGIAIKALDNLAHELDAALTKANAEERHDDADAIYRDQRDVNQAIRALKALETV